MPDGLVTHNHPQSFNREVEKRQKISTECGENDLVYARGQRSERAAQPKKSYRLLKSVVSPSKVHLIKRQWHCSE